MDELNVKNQIAEALREPEVPRNLVERTVVRARAITAGRAAEQQLAAQLQAQVHLQHLQLRQHNSDLPNVMTQKVTV